MSNGLMTDNGTGGKKKLLRPSRHASTKYCTCILPSKIGVKRLGKIEEKAQNISLVSFAGTLRTHGEGASQDASVLRDLDSYGTHTNCVASSAYNKPKKEPWKIGGKHIPRCGSSQNQRLPHIQFHRSLPCASPRQQISGDIQCKRLLDVLAEYHNAAMRANRPKGKEEKSPWEKGRSLQGENAPLGPFSAGPKLQKKKKKKSLNTSNIYDILKEINNESILSDLPVRKRKQKWIRSIHDLV